ncbi:hypothetical protein BS47DRAFT_1361525 [Hydnum rufescens UP504]|uniref:Uncharacterized protein n=1 Tax=Hydnum rufescens UP504 TaxID=1448309 RepID=A0A9P6AZD2_9AGAM|nr:hypothetical protein BS47DRAFT_1361525 [Hydnum rufescens UP504]
MKPNQTDPAKQNHAKLHDAIPNETTPNETAGGGHMPPKWPCKPHTHYSGCVVVLDEPPVCTVTQAQSAHPLNMTINEIAYHTPAACENPLQKKGMCAATHNPQPDPRAQCPNTHTYATTDEIQYHTPAAAGLPSMHKTPPNKNTNGKPMCTATRNLIQEPMTMSQNKYHTPALAVAWKEQPKLLLCITLKIVFMNPPVPHTHPSSNGTTPTQADSTTHLLGWVCGAT